MAFAAPQHNSTDDKDAALISLFGEEEVRALQQSWAAYDKNRDGKVTVDELASGLLQRGGVAPADIAKMLKCVDKDHDGLVTINEFLRAKAVVRGGVMSDEDMADARRVFDEFDKDGGGSIEVAELEKICAELGVQTTRAGLQHTLEAIDHNNDGSLQFEEFCPVLALVKWESLLNFDVLTMRSQLAELQAAAQEERHAQQGTGKASEEDGGWELAADVKVKQLRRQLDGKVRMMNALGAEGGAAGSMFSIVKRHLSQFTASASVYDAVDQLFQQLKLDEPEQLRYFLPQVPSGVRSGYFLCPPQSVLDASSGPGSGSLASWAAEQLRDSELAIVAAVGGGLENADERMLRHCWAFYMQATADPQRFAAFAADMQAGRTRGAAARASAGAHTRMERVCAAPIVERCFALGAAAGGGFQQFKRASLILIGLMVGVLKEFPGATCSEGEIVGDREKAFLVRTILDRADPAYKPPPILSVLCEPPVLNVIKRHTWQLRLLYDHYMDDLVQLFKDFRMFEHSGVNAQSIRTTMTVAMQRNRGFCAFVEAICRCSLLFFPLKDAHAQHILAGGQDTEFTGTKKQQLAEAKAFIAAELPWNHAPSPAAVPASRGAAQASSSKGAYARGLPVRTGHAPGHAVSRPVREVKSAQKHRRARLAIRHMIRGEWEPPSPQKQEGLQYAYSVASASTSVQTRILDISCPALSSLPHATSADALPALSVSGDRGDSGGGLGLLGQ